MKARPSDYIGNKANRTLSLPTFSVTSKSATMDGLAQKRPMAFNVSSLEHVVEEAADRQRSLLK
jgi:hypothetical protein